MKKLNMFAIQRGRNCIVQRKSMKMEMKLKGTREFRLDRGQECG